MRDGKWDKDLILYLSIEILGTDYYMEIKSFSYYVNVHYYNKALHNLFFED